MSINSVYVLEYISYFGQEYELAGIYSTLEKAEKEAERLERITDISDVSILEEELDIKIKTDEL